LGTQRIDFDAIRIGEGGGVVTSIERRLQGIASYSAGLAGGNDKAFRNILEEKRG